MIKTLRYTAISLAAAIASGMAAQDLKTEVEIRYEENPQLQNFNKLTVNPSLNLPVERTVTLPYSSRGVGITVSGSISTLDPASYADTIYSSPFRGYAALGFMTKFNMAASAGYKLLNTDHTRLNAWLQYDGAVYKGTAWQQSAKQYMRRHAGTVGVDLHQAVGRESFIDAGIDYTFSRYNTGIEPYMRYQNVNRVNVEATWSQRHKELDFGLGAGYHHFAFSNLLGFELPLKGESAQRETRFNLSGFFSGKFAGASKAGVDVDMSHLSYPYRTGYEFDDDFRPAWLKTRFSHTLLSVTPYYCFDIENFYLDLGARIDMTFNDGKFFHIAPRASATWIPADVVKLYVKAGGGEWQNTLSSLYDITPYLLPYMAYHNSHLPITAEVGVNIGSWRGLHAGISMEYARANQWLMPLSTDDGYAGFIPMDMKGYRIRLSAGYRFRELFEINASYEMAPQKPTHGYYLWRDRAKSVANIDLLISPTNRLDITLGWEYRGGRAQYENTYLIDFTPGVDPESAPRTPGYIRHGLRSVNNLKAGAAYRITDRWSAFARGENLLNRNYWLIGGEPAQGITGLVGVTYKF